MRNPINSARNVLARSQGYGGCGICGDTWNWKPEHSFRLGNHGMFPICEDCWKTRSKDEIHRAIDATVLQWLEGNNLYSDEKYHPIDYALIQEAHNQTEKRE